MKALRVAVALARTRNAGARTIDEIAMDADRLYTLAKRARVEVERQRPPDRHEDRAAEILARYGGEIVRQRDPAGCVMGARFADGPRTGFQSIFFIS